MKLSEFVHPRLYPLLFEPTYYYGSDEVLSYTAIVSESMDDSDIKVPPIFQKFSVWVDYSTPEDRYFTNASFRDEPPEQVGSFDEGILLCNKWYRQYWTTYLEMLARAIVHTDLESGSDSNA